MTTSWQDLKNDTEERAKQLGHVLGSWEQMHSSRTFISHCERCGKRISARLGTGRGSIYGVNEPSINGPAITSRCDSHQLLELTDIERETDEIASSLGHVLGTWERDYSLSHSECIVCGQGAHIIADSKVEYEGALKEDCAVDWREREEQFKKKANDIAASSGHVLDWTCIKWTDTVVEPYIVQGWCPRCKTVARMNRTNGEVYSWPANENCNERIENMRAGKTKQARSEANKKNLALSGVLGIGVIAIAITAFLIASAGAGMILLFPFVLGGVIWLGFMLYASFQGARESASRHSKGPISFTLLLVIIFVAILLLIGIVAIVAPDV